LLGHMVGYSAIVQGLGIKKGSLVEGEAMLWLGSKTRENTSFAGKFDSPLQLGRQLINEGIDVDLAFLPVFHSTPSHLEDVLKAQTLWTDIMIDHWVL